MANLFNFFFLAGKMGQWDNPRSIAMLFTGAFLVSLGLIALLNVEVHNRAIHGKLKIFFDF